MCNYSCLNLSSHTRLQRTNFNFDILVFEVDQLVNNLQKYF